MSWGAASITCSKLSRMSNSSRSRSASQKLLEAVDRSRTHAQRMGDGRTDEIGVRDWGERYESNPVGEICAECLGDAQRQARLADTTGASQRDQPYTSPLQESADLLHFALASDKRCQRVRRGHGELNAVRALKPLGRCGGELGGRHFFGHGNPAPVLCRGHDPRSAAVRQRA